MFNCLICEFYKRKVEEKMLKIIFDAREGRFISAEGSEYFNSRYILGEGWTCRIRSDGVVICKYTENQGFKYCEVCLKVNQKGIVTISRLSGIRENIKRFRTKGWPGMATITLYGGDFERANCFFNSINEQKNK